MSEELEAKIAALEGDLDDLRMEHDELDTRVQDLEDQVYGPAEDDVTDDEDVEEDEA